MLINGCEIDVSKYETKEIDGEIFYHKNTDAYTLFNQKVLRCRGCLKNKIFSDFHLGKGSFLGVVSYCKECAKDIKKKDHPYIKGIWRKGEQIGKSKRTRNFYYNGIRVWKNCKNKFTKFGKFCTRCSKFKTWKEYGDLSIGVGGKKYFCNDCLKSFLYSVDRLPLGYECRNNDNMLEVRCFNSNCNKWHIPLYSDVCSRFNSERTSTGGNNLYCCQECKDACPDYNMNTAKEVRAADLGLSVAEYDTLMSSDRGIWQQTLRDAKDIALYRDDFKCQHCGSESDLQVHHIKPVATCLNTDDEYLIYEVDNMITLCHNCHKDQHRTVIKTGAVSRCAIIGGGKCLTSL